MRKDYFQVFHCSLAHNRAKPDIIEFLSVIPQSLGDWLTTLGCIHVTEHHVALQMVIWRIFNGLGRVAWINNWKYIECYP